MNHRSTIVTRLGCLLTALVFFFVVPGGCGTEVGNPKKPGTSKVADDQEAATTVVTSNLNEATSSISEDVSGSQVALAGLQLVNNTAFTRTCAEQDGVVIVSETGEVSVSDEVTRRIGVVKRSAVGTENTKRIWSDSAGAVRCNGKSDGAKVSIAAFTKAQLAIDFTRQRTVAVDLVRRGTTTALQRRAVQVKGTRDISIVRSSDSSTTRLDKTLKTSLSRDLSYVKSSGESVQIASKVFTDKDKPLKVQIYFENGAWTRRVITSGRLVSQQEGDSSVVLDFEGTEYSRTGGCTPVAGKISGAIYREGEGDAALTFDVSFGADGGSIKFSDGREEDYVAEKCSLDG